MSSNVLKFRLKKEVELDKDLKPVEVYDDYASLYACIDGIWANIASVQTLEEAIELIKPENIKETFVESLSDVEYDNIMAVLNAHPEYYFFDEVFNYKEKE